MTTPIITLEEHYSSAHIPDPFRAAMPEPLLNKLFDLDGERIQHMNEGHVSMQVISHAATPGNETPELCRLANNELAAAVSESGGRFAGFAILPLMYTDAAVAELERCVLRLGFCGALMGHTANNIFLDSNRFQPIFEKAAELDVPIYIHPTLPEPEIRDKLYSGAYPEQVTTALSTRLWGWHADTALLILKMYSARIFDRIPKLKIVLGHNGEMLPYMLDRITYFSGQTYSPPLQRSLRTVFDENLWITTSGMFSLAPMACLVRQVKPERLMYSVDYPFSSNKEGLTFLVELEESGLMEPEQFRAFIGGNAIDLLKLDVRHLMVLEGEVEDEAVLVEDDDDKTAVEDEMEGAVVTKIDTEMTNRNSDQRDSAVVLEYDHTNRSIPVAPSSTETS